MASTYDKEILSTEDYAEVEKLGEEWRRANKAGDIKGKESAAARAEAIRSAYGYSGGDNGQEYITLEGYEGAEKMQGAAADYDAAYQGVADAQKAQAEASKADIDKQRETALKQAYIGNMMDQKNVDQQLKARGITGGLSESTRAAMQNNYRTNRNSIETAAIEAKKDVDLGLQQKLAETELSRAGTKYNSDMGKANFENTAANNNRDIKLNEKQIEQNERQLKQAEESATLSKYMTFLQNGWVDDSNAAQIATAIGVSPETVKKASKAVSDGNYQSMALSLMSAGVYDDSFVNLFDGRFSAETLKTFAAQNKPQTSTGGSSGSYSGSSGKKLSFDQLGTVINTVGGYIEAGAPTAAESYLNTLYDHGYITEDTAQNIYQSFFTEDKE